MDAFNDTCTVHGGPRCRTDLKLYGSADHCEFLRDTPEFCRFPDGTGIGDDVEVACAADSYEEVDDGDA